MAGIRITFPRQVGTDVYQAGAFDGSVGKTIAVRLPDGKTTQAKVVDVTEDDAGVVVGLDVDPSVVDWIRDSELREGDV